MKYLIVHASGAVEAPRAALGGRTPLQAANTPALDGLARGGALGLVTIPAAGVAAHSDLVQFALLGYDPQKDYPGPAPFEAAGQGVVLDEHDVAYVCTMVTLSSGTRSDVKKLAPQVVMDDPTAGGIETEQARELIDAVNEQLGSETIQFYPGSGHRHVMVWVGGKARATCFPPQEALNQAVGDFLPRGDGAEVLRQLMEASVVILRDHPVNEERRADGQKPANCLWLWGQGRWPRVPTLADRYPVTGSILADSDLHRGVGICAGLEPLDVGEGQAVASATLRELEKKDLVYVHVTVPAEASESEDPKAALEYLEAFDRDTMRVLLDGLAALGPHRVLAVCDSVRPAQHLAAQPARALYALYQGPTERAGTTAVSFNEVDAEASPGRVRDATRLLRHLLPDARR